MKARKNIVTFYRGLAGLPVEKQREACHATARSLGCKIVAEYTAGELGDDAREWRKGLRSTDIAMVAVLQVIPEKRRPGYRPSTALAEALADLCVRQITIILAMRDLSSEDEKRWAAEVASAHNAVSSGRQLSPRQARKMARKSVEKRAPGASNRWLADAMTPAREAMARIWRDPVHESAAAALAAMPDDVQSDIGSVETAYRIFGRRRPGDKSAGGRPRKSKRKT